MTTKEKFLRSLFEPAVDGGCSDAYMVILRTMQQLPIEAKKISFTLQELNNVLRPLSRKWQKEIDKVTG